MALNPKDQGIVFYGTQDTSTTYYDKKGTSQSSVAILPTYLASTEFQIGAGDNCLITCHGAVGGVTSFEVACQIKRVESQDTASGVTWRWQDIQIEPIDGSTGAAVVQTIEAADLLQPDGTAADFGFATTSTRLSGTARVICKYTGGAPNATTKLVVAVDVR